MRYSEPYNSAIKLQRAIMEKHEAASNKDLALLAKTFVELEQLKLRMRMKPAPKPVDVQHLVKNKAKQGFTAPLE